MCLYQLAEKFFDQRLETEMAPMEIE